MDPLLTFDGRPYGPVRYEQLVQERYLISKHIHTSYLDLGKITPIERKYLLEFIKQDLQRESDIRDKVLQNMKK